MKSLRFLSPVVLLALASCGRSEKTAETTTVVTPMPPSVFHPDQFSAPHPAQQPKELTAANGDKRTDEYYWLNERDNPGVRAYLDAENRYADSVLAPVATLREQLYEEMRARIKEDDNSVPYFKSGYWYYSRFETGKEYPLYCRKKGSLEAAEEVMIDVNEMAKGHDYCVVDGLSVSPDNRTLYYIVDYTGRNLFKGKFLDLQTRRHLPDEFETAGTSAWSNDGKYFFYDPKDPVTLRTDKIWRHEMGASTKKDALVYTETDETVYAYLGKSKDDKFIFITHAYTETVETHFLSADNPTGEFRVIRPREKGFYYDVEHHGDQFVIRTNWNAQNFRLMTAPDSDPAPANWKEMLPHRPDVLLSGIDVYQDFLVVGERKNGLKQIRIIRWADKSEHYLDFGEPTYDANIFPLPDFNSTLLRYNFSSLKTPATVIDYDPISRQKTVKKVQPVLGDFSSDNYATEFVWVKARDGALVPVSLVYRKGVKRDGSAPCLLVGYGSYGFSYDPGFNRNALSLLDRGFVYAIAHIRGGMEMGYSWYENGKMMHKMNTFTDFIDCSKALCDQKYTSADRLFASGRSAGGLLMGAVANMAPEQYKGIIAGVPFVDVLTTMSDPSIPLTTGEYGEWGNPANAEEYNYMKQYSPYDNVKAKNYPNLLVLTSFADSQVQYFEPAKWVARLRDQKTDHNVLLFKTNMSGSHGGSSGRFEALKERAMEYSWMMGLLGMSGEVLKQ